MTPTVQSPTTTRTPAETVEAFVRAFNAHDVDALLALLAPDFAGLGYHAQQPVGKEGYAKVFVAFGHAFPDFRWEDVTNLMSTGDAVAFEAVETATFTGPYVIPGHTFAPTHRAYRVPVAAFFRLNADGLITTYRLYGNILEMFEQIGLDPQQMASWKHEA